MRYFSVASGCLISYKAIEVLLGGKRKTVKITIEIPDDEIRTEVLTILTRRIADSIFGERYSVDGNAYRRMLKEAVNAVMKEHTSEIIDRCIPQATSYIGKKGVKKLLEMCEGVSTDT